MESQHPIDVVLDYLHSSPPEVTAAAEVLKSFLRQTPYAQAWQLYIFAHEGSSGLTLPESVHRQWLAAVGVDVAAARLYLAAAWHITSPNRTYESHSERIQAFNYAKTLLEFALVTPMDELEEILKAYEPIAAAALEGTNQGYTRGVGGLGNTNLPPQLKKRFDAALSIFEYEGPWPSRQHSSTESTHCRHWSATFQKLFSTYVSLATASQPLPTPFPSTVQLHVSLLSPEEIQQLAETQLRRISLAMRQAVEQCPTQEVLLVNYCAFVAAATNSTETAKAALDAHLKARGREAEPFTPVIAALSVALNKISTPAELFELLKASTASTKIAHAHHCLDLSVLTTLKRFRDVGKEATESTNDYDRWHMFSEWLEVECNAVGNKTFAAKIAEKGYDKLQAEAQGFGQRQVDALALFTHKAYQMHQAHGTPAEGQLLAEKLVEHLSKLTKESVMTGTSSGDMVAMETSRFLASVPVNTLKEAVNLLGVQDAQNALKYINGEKPRRNTVDLLEIAHNHSVSPLLPLMSSDEMKWAIITKDMEESTKRYEDDTGRTLPNEIKRRFHRCQQAMPWGLATIDDTLSSEPLIVAPKSGGGGGSQDPSGWAAFTPPVNPAMKENINHDSDEIRAPFTLKGAIGRALTVDERTHHRLQREEMYRSAEGKKKSTELDQLPLMIARLVKRLPTTTDGCASLANLDPMWLIETVFTGPPLNLGALIEALTK